MCKKFEIFFATVFFFFFFFFFLFWKTTSLFSCRLVIKLHKFAKCMIGGSQFLWQISHSVDLSTIFTSRYDIFSVWLYQLQQQPIQLATSVVCFTNYSFSQMWVFCYWFFWLFIISLWKSYKEKKNSLSRKKVLFFIHFFYISNCPKSSSSCLILCSCIKAYTNKKISINSSIIFLS